MSNVMHYDEAAAWLRISKRTLERLVRDGRIRPAYVYRRVLFTEAMLEEFLQKSAEPVVASRRRLLPARKKQKKGDGEAKKI